jgi:hypothetical protein
VVELAGAAAPVRWRSSARGVLERDYSGGLVS